MCQRPAKDSLFYGVTTLEKTTFICPINKTVYIGSTFQQDTRYLEVEQRDTDDLIERASVLWPDVREYILRGMHLL